VQPLKKERKKERKTQKNKELKEKKKGKYYNCGKEGYFAANYYFKKKTALQFQNLRKKLRS
jgi:hypothetical protein